MTQQWIADALDTVARNMRAAGREPLGYRNDGRPIWPIFGGSGDGGDGGGQGGSDGDGGSDGNGGGQQGGQGGSGAPAFPPNTRVEEMTPEQQAAYWKDSARKHEQRNRAYDNLTPEALKELRTKAAAHDKMQLDLGTDQERAVAQAKTDAEAAAAAKYEPQLAKSAIHAAAAAAGLNVSSVDQALEAGFTDLRQFIVNGQVSTDRVQKYVDSIKPDRGNSGGQHQRGPSGGGTGHRDSKQTGTAADRGRAEAQRRFGKKSA